MRRFHFAFRTLLGLLGLLACVAILFAGEASARPPQPGAAPGTSQPSSQLSHGSTEVRREAAPPAQGQPPRVGTPAPHQPLRSLGSPNFGPNYRANTDPQSPNLAQQEPSIGVNPKNPLNVVVAAKDERAGTNTKHVWIYTSTDGGVSWINQPFPLRTPLAPYSSDPVVNFTDDGVCYVTSLPYIPLGTGATGEGPPAVGIQIARSFDGGITFEPAAEVTNNPYADKEWTWVDNYPGSPFYHRLYVAWMDFNLTPIGVRVSYSSDRGVSWQQSTLAQSAYQFPMPLALPNGEVIVTYRALSGWNAYVRSTDGGVTFGPEEPIAFAPFPECPPDNPGCSIWRLSPIPVNSVNRMDGTEVLAWTDGSEGRATVRYSRSTDDGITWSAPAVLAPSGVPNTYQVEPWVEADENGLFHAIWYDDRENPNSSIFHIYYSQSSDNGATWSPAVRISSATSDLRIGIPSSYARAAGDYIQVTASHGNVYAAWTDTRSGTGEDIFVVRGTYGGTPTPTPTGTLPTATSTRTRTHTPTRTFTPTSTPTVCGGGQYLITQGIGAVVPGTDDVGIHCDDCTSIVNLPFLYRLYDQNFAAVNISSNGNLQFLGDVSSGTNECLPATIEHSILAHWDDLRTDAEGNYGVFTSLSGSAPNRVYNIEWRTQLANRRGDANFEVRLYEGQTRFDIIYGTLAQYGMGATVGVQQGAALNYTQFECNTGGLGEGVKLTFVLPPCGTATPTVTGTPPTATRTSTPTPTVCVGDYGYVVATATIEPGNTDLSINCDDCIGTVYFPFPVRFYGGLYTTADVSSNGNIQFTSSNPLSFNNCLPDINVDAAIMPHWDDLLTDVNSGCPVGGCGVFTSVSGVAPNRVFNIEWRAVRYSLPSMPVNFEVRFYENQPYFDFVYGQVNANGGDATVGVQDDQTRFTEFSCLMTSLSQGMMIRWTLQGCTTATATVTRTATPCPTCTSTPTGTATHTRTITPTATATPCGLMTFQGAITLQDPTQNGRHFRDEVRSTCEVPKSCPDILEIAPRHFDSYTLTNPNPTTQCVTVDITTKCNNIHFIFAAAYLDSFDPDNICVNYLADLGASPYPHGFMAFNVPPARDVVIVVSEVTTNQGCDDYTMMVRGLGVCGTPTSTPTGTPPTATRTPTSTATPCGYNFSTATATIEPGITDIGNHCDDCVTNLSLPFPVALYGTQYNSARVSSNGNIQFVTSSSNHLNTCLPAPSLSAALLPYWTDLVTNCKGCGIFTSVSGSAPSRIFNIEWRASYFKGGGTANFEARLREGNPVFDFVYGEITDQGSNSTVGAQYPGATYFNQHQCNAGGLVPGLLVRGTPMDCGAPTQTPTAVAATPSRTPTPTWTLGTVSATPIRTGTSTNTPTATRTATPSSTRTFTSTTVPTISQTRTPTLTWTAGPTRTSTWTRTPVPPTNTPTDTPISTPNNTSTPCGISFSDVQTGDYFYEAVRYLYCAGVISGYADGTFRPYNNATRGQMCKIVVLAFGLEIYVPTEPTFTDVPPSDPFYQYVETAAYNEIVSGYADGTFRPYNNVTRGQLSKIVVIAAGWPLVNPPVPTFSDVPTESAFYTYIETAFEHGIISGYADGTFRPGNNATRGQIAKIVYNAVLRR